MTQSQECAAQFATTREQRLREETNAAQSDFEEQLLDCRDLPGMVEFLDRVAARLEALGAA